MSSPSGQHHAPSSPESPLYKRPGASPSTWIMTALVLLFAVVSFVAGGPISALVVVAFFLFLTGMYTLIVGRPSWLCLPTRKWGGVITGAAFLTLVIGGLLLSAPADEGTTTASNEKALATSTPTPSPTSRARDTSTAEASASAAAEETAKAEASVSAAAEETAKAKADADAKIKADADAKVKAEADAKIKADADAKAKADAEAAGTPSQQNALRAANDYLRFMAFSRPSLISQLEYEKYSTEDATWAVDHLVVDWNEQAAESAKNYLEFSAFSGPGLYDQLIYEGFTPEEAQYGVSQTGL